MQDRENVPDWARELIQEQSLVILTLAKGLHHMTQALERINTSMGVQAQNLVDLTTAVGNIPAPGPAGDSQDALNAVADTVDQNNAKIAELTAKLSAPAA